MTGRIRLPANIERDDQLAFGLTARQLTILATAALLSYALFTAASAYLPLPLAAASVAPLALVAALLALGRRDGLPADRLALLAAHQLTRSRRQLLAPEGLPTTLPGMPRRAGAAPLEPPVRAVLRSGVVELAGRRYCQLLRASTTSFALRSEEEQAALVEAFGRFLNSTAEPVQLLIASEPVALDPRAELLERAALALPEPGLRRAALGHARFLAELAAGEQVRRREVLLVLSTRGPDRKTGQLTLERRATEAIELLRAAGVELHPLDGPETAARLARALDPPGPAFGSDLAGVVHAC